MAILATAQQDEVVLGGVSEVGEFRIRNSAKAFSILSSGLYANKIKAIIRELSTNAVDSHVAAGRATTPFDVHLPNQMEAWFAIRDYGTGLDHDQVTQIYTTYFESTKTGSNDFVGALGLGSKSPFAYTDNFTVTAIKDGVKRIYSAFINPQGVPSIAKMGEEASDELSGVEIKFSVNDAWEFSKFRDEAASVYRYFTLRPVVSGSAEFQFRDIEYDVKDIAPGVHSLKRSGGNSVAVMGNIAYPIDLPNAQYKELGTLASLLDCGLEIHFGIGELDFQASREGLSYIPQTINAIKAKLSAITDVLAERLGEEADKIDNKWDRAIFLLKRKETNLWRDAVVKYVTDSKFELIEVDPRSAYYTHGKTYDMDVDALATKYNIVIDAFHKYGYSKTAGTITPLMTHDGNTVTRTWEIIVREGMNFVKNDLKTGALARAKYHFNNIPNLNRNSSTVFVMSKVDKTKDADFDGFLAAIDNPPTVMLASDLLEKERKVRTVSAESVSILTLEERASSGWGRGTELVWANGGKVADYDKKVKHVYVPLSGFNSLITSIPDVKRLAHDLASTGIPSLTKLAIHGVRKADLELVQKQKNWVQLDTYITNALKAVKQADLKAIALGEVDNLRYVRYNAELVKLVQAANPNSPYVVTMEKFKDVEKDHTLSRASMKRIFDKFSTKKVDFDALATEAKADVKAFMARYPLLANISYAEAVHTAEYINLIDAAKK